MAWPLIVQYIESIENPFGLFKTLNNVECIKDFYGNPCMNVGGNSVVFKVKVSGQLKALKCYTKPKQNTDEISKYLNLEKDNLIHPSLLLKKEMYVYTSINTGKYYDIVVSDWCEGKTLDFEIKRAVHTHDGQKLNHLCERFNIMASEILSKEWAHGDIKPENIIVLSNRDFKLIDTDAMYFPSLKSSNEIGTQNYCHPLKCPNDYGPHIDDYPLLIIAVSLKALSIKPELYNKYNIKGNLILVTDELLNGQSECYDEILDIFALHGEWKYIDIMKHLKNPNIAIEGISEFFNSLNKKTSTIQDNNTHLETFRQNGKWGYINTANEIVIPAIFDSALEFSEGLACVKIRGYNHYINTAGNIIINGSEYDSIKPFHNSKAEVTKQKEKIIIDKQGYIITPCIQHK